MRGVRDVAVIDQQRGTEKYLCAYVVMEPGMRAKQVREEVAEELSEVMRPSRYVEMEELPRTISGKVDRRGLPEGGEGGVSEEYVEARSGLEEVIAGIWKEVLGVGRVGVHDNFFELGGHSLRATQVLGRIRGVLGVEIESEGVVPQADGRRAGSGGREEAGRRRAKRRKKDREGEPGGRDTAIFRSAQILVYPAACPRQCGFQSPNKPQFERGAEKRSAGSGT